MTPERWQKIKSLFQGALEQAPQQRSAWLNEACAEDVTLREEVTQLLAEEEMLGSFIELPAVPATATLVEEWNDRRIGPYRVLHELGHGGMGVVLLAERADEQFQQRVAIKLVRRGYDVAFILKRFRAERQILASFTHPNIARLLDGGVTEEGLPYLVMEYVEGTPLDRYCDERRLDTEARLKLFLQVCDAVHYAHRNLIVHRDLKPSNILVTADGTPKLLDFGIAKILNPASFPETVQPTGTSDRPMTLAYASPEQVRGQKITTASDVFSLGVLLYELLTGHRPYHVPGSLPHELARLICEQEPERPSTVISRTKEITQVSGNVAVVTPQQVSEARAARPDKLRRQLQGDLDNIVLMALRKEPERRYASVEQFAQDIENYQQGRPVTARHDTVTYRAAKFVRRHRAGVAAATFVLLTLIGSTIISVRQARLAQRRFNDVRQLANQYLFEFHDAIETLPGATPARQLVVKRALEYLDRLAQESRGDHSLQAELAGAYLKVGDVQGRPGFANLGQKTEALASYRKALTLREAPLAADPNNATLRREHATNLDRIGDALRTTGDSAAALPHYQRALALREALAPGDLSAQVELGVSYERIGDQLALLGQRDEAIARQRAALAIFEKATAAEPANAQYQRRLFVACVKLGDRLGATGDQRGALAAYERARGIAQTLAQAGGATNARAQRELAVAYDKVGNALAALSDHAAALAQYQQAYDLRAPLAAADPKNGEAQRDLATSYGKLAAMHEQLGRGAQALDQLRRALAIDEALARADPNDAQIRLDIAFDHEQIGQSLARQQQFQAAAAAFRQALQLRQTAVQTDAANDELQRDLAGNHALLGEALLQLAPSGDGLAQAREQFQLSLARWQQLQARRALQPAERADADKAAAAIEQCNARLAGVRRNGER
jgi:non-specific serine/threonine protein kinase/serine/threonine-protein kinase